MPVRYDFGSGLHVVSCSTGCGTSVRTYRVEEGSHDETGHPITDTFRWERGSRRFYSWCRSCERSRRRERQSRNPRPTRGTSRVPGTSRGVGIERRFGVEFELTLPSNISRERIYQELQNNGISVGGTNGWKVKGDGSISAGRGHVGYEVVSPPMRGEDGERQLRLVARLLRDLGGQVNRTCGTHVHHEINDLSVEAIKNVVRGWHRNQRLIDGLVSGSRRNGQNMYCRPLSSEDVERIDRVTTLEEMRYIHVDRYRTLNLQSYGRYGTIEVRQHQGTLDGEKVVSWLRLGQGIIDATKVQEFPVVEASRMRDFLGSLGTHLNETARTFLLGRAIEFNTVTV